MAGAQACKRAGLCDSDSDWSRVKAGYGEAVCGLLDGLADGALRCVFERPAGPGPCSWRC